MEAFIKPQTIYVLNKNEAIIAVFNKDDEDTLIDPEIKEVQNSEATLTFQVPANSEKWKTTYNPENLYLVENKMFSANFTDSISRDRTDEGEDIITIVAYERERLLAREFTKAYNSTTGYEELDENGQPVENGEVYIDDFMVVVLSGGNKPLTNGVVEIPTTHEKGTSGYALDAILYGTGWKTGTCDVEGTYDLETDLTTVYDNILQIQELWGGILIFDSVNKIIHHRDETKYLPYSGYEVRYQKNIISSNYIGDNKIITKLAPLGESNLNIKSVNNDSVWLNARDYISEWNDEFDTKKYENITESIYSAIEFNDSITDPEQLLKWGKRKLLELCMPRRELSFDIAQLKEVEGFEHENVSLNDIVDVIDFDFIEDKTIQLRVIDYTHKVWDYSDATLVVGDITLEGTDIFKKTVQATNMINNGTLDASKIIVYYKNFKSLKETLKAIDKSIVDTRSELIKADDAIIGRVTQTETKVDTINNEVIKQNSTIAELEIGVGKVEAEVNAIRDISETLTGYGGKILLPSAMTGEVLDLSIRGYEGAFRATYVSDDTVLSDDLYLLDNIIDFMVYSDNRCPTKPDEWNVVNKILTNKKPILIEENKEIYLALNIIGYEFVEAKFYNISKKIISTEDLSGLTEKGLITPEGTFYLDISIKRTDGNDIEAKEISTIKPQIMYSDRKEDYVEGNTQFFSYDIKEELREIVGEEYVADISPNAMIGYEIGSISNVSGNKAEAANRIRNINILDIEDNKTLNFKITDENYVFSNIYFYDYSKNYIGNWNELNPEDTIDNLKEKLINVPENTRYIYYTLRSPEDIDIPKDFYSYLTLYINKKDKVYDEFLISENKAYLIRRIGVADDGTKYILNDPTIEDYGDITINTILGDNYIDVLYFTPTLVAKYVKQNRYTDMFATKVELGTSMEITDEKILLEAKKTVHKDEVLQDLNTRLEVSAEALRIIGNKIIIDTTYFDVTAEGKLICTGGEIAGWIISQNKLYKDRSGLKRGTAETDIVIYAGADPNTENNIQFYVKNNGEVGGNNFHITLSDLLGIPNMDKLIGISADDWVGNSKGMKFFHNTTGSISKIYGQYGTWSFLDNKNKWVYEGVVGIGNTPYFQDKVLFDAIATRVMDGVHNENIMDIYRRGNNAESPHVDIYCETTVEGYKVATNASDERIKNNILDSETQALELINKIHHKSFDWDKEKAHKEGHIDIGYIAQELIEIDPNFVIYNERFDTYQIDTLYVLSTTTKAVQEFYKEFIEFKNKITNKLGGI